MSPVLAVSRPIQNCTFSCAICSSCLTAYTKLNVCFPVVGFAVDVSQPTQNLVFVCLLRFRCLTAFTNVVCFSYCLLRFGSLDHNPYTSVFSCVSCGLNVSEPRQNCVFICLQRFKCFTAEAELVYLRFSCLTALNQTVLSCVSCVLAVSANDQTVLSCVSCVLTVSQPITQLCFRVSQAFELSQSS